MQISNIPNFVYKVFKKTKTLKVLDKIVSCCNLRFISIWNIIRCEHHRDAILYLFDEIFKDDIKVQNRLNKIKRRLFSISIEETR